MVTKAEAISRHKQGRHNEAESLYRELLESDPDDPVILYFLGMLYQQTGRPQQALPLIERVAKDKPDAPGHHTVLAHVLAALGRIDDAQAACSRALDLKPNNPVALNLAGHLLHLRGEWRQAVEAYKRAIALQPRNVLAHHNLGITLHYLGRTDEAIQHYKQAINLEPANPQIHYNLGLTYRQVNNKRESKECFAEALRLNPEHLAARYALINCNIQICDWTGLESDCRELEQAFEPFLAGAGQDIISPTVLNYLPVDPGLHDRVARHHARRISEQIEPVARLLKRRERNHERLHIGYVSPDFCAHAVGGLIYTMFGHHDRKSFKIHCYGLRDRDDIYARRIREECDVYRDMSSASLLEASQQIIDDEIDILVDMSGYTESARPEIFACRPAPLQAAYLGYLNTMTADFMDYVIADETVLPKSAGHTYTERIVRMPGTFMVISPLETSSTTPSREDLGLPENTFVFASFNNTYKVEPEVFACWLRILNRCPDSVLWLYAGNNEETAENLKQEATERGLDPARIIIAPGIVMKNHMARMHHANLFLDAFRYNAGATAACSQMAGLPVLTKSGDSILSRMGSSLNHALGLEELNCPDVESYETTAVNLYENPARLDNIAARLRAARESSKVFDTAFFVANLEDAMRKMWARHLAGKPPADFAVAGTGS